MAMLQLFALSILICFCWSDALISHGSSLDLEERFATFKKRYDRHYDSLEEEERRLRIFRANLKKIQILNEEEQGTAVYGVTEFSDYTKSEFRKYALGLNVHNHEDHSKKKIVPDSEFSDINLPTYFDWRDSNAVTPVKNQKMCGSCWAFSVTGNIEGLNAIQNKRLLSFSEQELLDCDKTDNGCGGGYMTDAYDAIKRLGGLETESDYPYEGRNDQCRLSKNKIKAVVLGYKNLTTDESQIADWLYNNGPVSIALNANAMQFYFGGVSHPLKFFCNPKSLDHGVLLTGFGIQKTKFTRKMAPYWAIKNSWGSFWGERGYYKLYRGSGACGVNQMASSAIIKHD